MVHLIRDITFNLTGTTISSANDEIIQPLQNLCVGATYQFSIYVGIINYSTGHNPVFTILVSDATNPDGYGPIVLFSSVDPCPNNACIPAGQTYGYSNFQGLFTVANNDSFELQLYTSTKTPKVAYNPILFDLVTLTLTALPAL